MSCYDKLTFSKKFSSKSKLDINDPTIQKQIIKKLEHTSKKEVKELLGIEPNSKESEFFDFIYKDKFVSPSFFQNSLSNEIHESMSKEEKTNILLDFIREKYSVITPLSFVQMFKDFVPSQVITVDQSREILRTAFKKEIVNLDNPNDTLLLLQLISPGATFKDEFPDVPNNKEMGKVNPRTDKREAVVN